MLKKCFFAMTVAIVALSLNASAQGRNRDRYDEDDREERRARREERAREEREDRIAEKMEKREQNIRAAANYGDNFVRVAPLRVLDIGGVGVGAEYERIFGESKMLGLVLPVSVLFEETSNNWIGNSYSDELFYNTYFYFCPGLKIYPFGQRRVTYAVGPSLMLGYGKAKQWEWINTTGGGGYYVEQEREHFNAGVIVMNYINFQITKNFCLGIDAGLGVRYIDKETVYDVTYNRGFNATGQFSMTLGMRF